MKTITNYISPSKGIEFYVVFISYL